MTSLTEIEQHAKAFADARHVLAERVQALTDDLEASKRRKLRGIKLAVATVAEKYSVLATAIDASPALFTKPRTMVMAGVKVGYAKSKGKISWDEATTVVKLIRKNHSDEADVLIKTTDTPIKKALENLSGAELKKLGVTLEEGGDYIVIKPTDSAIDKLVNALLAEAEKWEEV